ncbi:MAG: alkaline phosphatase family protein [Solirubrobacterales bacterium]
MTKLVLVVVDALKPAMLERAVAEGRAPLFGEIMRRGRYHPDCVSVFPSVTPAAAAAITTGRLPDEHGVPSICWYHRGEGRYVDYGSSGAAVRTFGVLRTITDTVYNINFDHLSRRTPTIFERLEDAGVRTACTPFLIYRGRTRHEMGLQGWMRRVAQAANLRQAVYGPSELFYGELYASQDVDCQATLARPGTRDPYSGCVGAYIERYDLYDFLLFSLPDNDHHSHTYGPQATTASIERADACLRQLADAGGGQERFLSDHAVILMSDHAQIAVSRRINLMTSLSDWRVLQPNDPDPASADVAVSPGARSAMVYALADSGARERLRGRVLRRLRSIEGVDLLAWLQGDEACLWSDRGELRFAPGNQLTDRRGLRWDVEGRLDAIEAETQDGVVASRTYPDALRRVWAALRCPGAGDVLVSAQREYEFVDWGGSDHVGGGSHGSLRRGDSLAALAFLNCGPDVHDAANSDRQWSITDVAGIVLDHFGVPA